MRLRSIRLSLALVACLSGLGMSAGRGAESAPLDIPVMLPLTGPAALVGESEQQSFQVFEKDINQHGGIRSRPLHFDYLDDQANPQIAVQLFHQATSGGAQVIFGGAFSATCKAIAPLVEESSNVIFYCLSTAIRPPADSYVFTSSYHPTDLVVKMLHYFAKHGQRQVAVLLGTDASGQEVANTLPQLFGSPALEDVKIVDLDRFDPNAVSLAAQMAKVAGAHPQALGVWAAGGIQTILRTMHDTGMDIPVAISPAFQVYSVMKQWADVLPKHIYFAAGVWSAYMDGGAPKGTIGHFYDLYKQIGTPPDGGSELAWDPLLIVTDALRKLGPDAKASQIHAYIEGLHGFSGTNGVYDFRTHDQRGVNQSSLVITEWSAKKNTWVLAPGCRPYKC